MTRTHVCCKRQETGRQADLTVLICVAGSGRSARVAKRHPAQNTSTVAEPGCLGFCNRHVRHCNVIKLLRNSPKGPSLPALAHVCRSIFDQLSAVLSVTFALRRQTKMRRRAR